MARLPTNIISFVSNVEPSSYGSWIIRLRCGLVSHCGLRLTGSLALLPRSAVSRKKYDRGWKILTDETRWAAESGREKKIAKFMCIARFIVSIPARFVECSCDAVYLSLRLFFSCCITLLQSHCSFSYNWDPPKCVAKFSFVFLFPPPSLSCVRFYRRDFRVSINLYPSTPLGIDVKSRKSNRSIRNFLFGFKNTFF